MTRRILIVEDDDNIRDNLKELLENEGYSILVARNGQEALTELAATRETDLPSVILLDVMMPVLDGFKFRTAQETNPRIANIPVIAMTAAGDITVQAIRLGARASIKKPVDINELLRIVQRYCG